METTGTSETFNKRILHPAEYELAARWYRFFCNQGFEAEILANRYGVVLRLNGDHSLIVVPCFDIYNMLKRKEQWGEVVVEDEYGRLKVLESLISDKVISGKTDVLIVGAKGLFLNWSDDLAVIGAMRGEDTWSHEWEEAEIFRCRFCQKVAIKSVFGSYEGRPCGHHEGDGYIEALDVKELQHMENQWSWTSHVDRNYKRNGLEKYDLYRAYSQNGYLLYVGQSNDWPRRMGEHKRSSSWLEQARQITITGYESKAELDYAEKLAIRSEGPLFNIVHKR